MTTWRSYWREVVGRAWTHAWRRARDKMGVSVPLTLLTACFLWWFASRWRVPYPLFTLFPGSVACAALVVFLVFFVRSLLKVPYQMHVGQAQAAEAAAQACAAETTRLTAELATTRAAQDARAARLAIQDTLGQFLAEGTDLYQRICEGSSGPLRAEVEAWLARLYPYVGKTLGAAALARLKSDAGLQSQTITDPPLPGGVARRLVTDGREITSAVVRNRCTRLQEFLAEGSRP